MKQARPKNVNGAQFFCLFCGYKGLLPVEVAYTELKNLRPSFVCTWNLKIKFMLVVCEYLRGLG